MIIPVSYPLSRLSPLYPGTPVISIHRHKSMDMGDSANTSNLSFNSHTGTHLDVPAHFCWKGSTVQDHFPINRSLYPAYCIDLSIEGCDAISPEGLDTKIQPIRDAVVLFVRTGWWENRNSDVISYCNDHPWVSEELPDFLREKCPDLRIFGIDQISISSPTHRDVGRECHRRFLCNASPILLLEDVNLADVRLLAGVYTLHVYPFLIDDLDGVPVVAVMEQ